MSRTTRIKHLIFFAGVIAIAVFVLYAPAHNTLDKVQSHSYTRMYFVPHSLKDMGKDRSEIQEPAIAVPILMYHGIRVKGELGTNTSRDTFIAHMEMLKREGYETITVHEYDLFREGKFTLPNKPIIITFDDGRRDSYYPVDQVLKKLGFKTTMFVATIKANEHDPFYLSWKELRKAQASGRWEIEAHGRHSHDVVPIDDDGTLGRYLTSRIFDEETGVLESIDDYKERAKEDYENGILDLIVHLGVDPRYYAIPLNDYGNVQNSNYDGALDYNKELTQQYFRLAFVEAAEENLEVLETFYNYKDTNPYKLKRLEAKNMSAEQLLDALKKYEPKDAELNFPNTGDVDEFLKNTQLLYGELNAEESGVVLRTSSSSNAARVLFGDRGWANYQITANMWPYDTREMILILYYTDEDNLILLDWEEGSISIIERVEGNERRVLLLSPLEHTSDNVSITAEVHNGLLTVEVDGGVVLEGYKTDLPRGAAGFGVWDPEGGQAAISSFEIKSLSTTQ